MAETLAVEQQKTAYYYGIYITLDGFVENWRQQVKPADAESVDVRIVLNGKRHDFTFEEFIEKLGLQ